MFKKILKILIMVIVLCTGVYIPSSESVTVNTIIGSVVNCDTAVNSMKYENFPRSIIRALQEIVNVASNCGSYVGFDFTKRNFGVNEYGTLIFRDVFFVK